MKVIIAPDSFKESLTAKEAANAIEKGFKEVYPEGTYIKIPMADGGEGTVQSLVDATEGKIKTIEVMGPLGTPVEAIYGLLGDGKTAVIEMASASGLHLVPNDKRNPLVTTTWGTGELIKAALNDGVNHIILGIGGSATNDGGSGMLQALGVKLLDQNGEQIGYGGGQLKYISTIEMEELDARIKDVTIEVACDVDNPLTGSTGASYIYGPQKGADSEMVKELDANLFHYSEMIKEHLGKEVNNIKGAGAAGGIGAGLVAFLSGELKRGIDIITSVTRLEDHVKDASLVITGEGKIDHQTIYGKTPIGVSKIAKKYNVPVICLAGTVTKDSDVVFEHGISALFSIVPGIMTLEEAIADAPDLMYRASKNIATAMKIG